MQLIENVNLNDVTDQYLMETGGNALLEIDTPSFMRREYGVALEDTGQSHTAGVILEPDEKIVNFLSVIKRKDFAMSA
ncbi:MAG: hypothetical protein GY950_10865 [bacterium]|nr:hypothetical protein [bacterium]